MLIWVGIILYYVIYTIIKLLLRKKLSLQYYIKAILKLQWSKVCLRVLLSNFHYRLLKWTNYKIVVTNILFIMFLWIIQYLLLKYCQTNICTVGGSTHWRSTSRKSLNPCLNKQSWAGIIYSPLCKAGEPDKIKSWIYITSPNILFISLS